MKLKAVLFDMDGIIIDSEPEYFKIEMALVKSLGIQFNEDDQRSYVGVNPHVMWGRIKKEYNLKQSVDELYSSEAKMIDKYYEYGVLNVIRPTVKLIKETYQNGCLCAVVSSSERKNIYHVLKRLKMREYFKFVVSNDDVKRCKPMPDIYLLAAKFLHVAPSDCIVIEDSIPGVIAAKAAGMKVIRYQNPDHFTTDEKIADYVVSDMREINFSLLEDILEA